MQSDSLQQTLLVPQRIKATSVVSRWVTSWQEKARGLKSDLKSEETGLKLLAHLDWNLAAGKREAAALTRSSSQ